MELPIVFHSKSKADSQINHSWTSEAYGHQTAVDIPAEFEGQGNGFSPEDLYALALQNCFIATFKVISSKSKCEYESIDVHLTLTLDRSSEGLPIMHSALLDVHITGAKNEERILRLLDKTTSACMILNSVKTELNFKFTVNGKAF